MLQILHGKNYFLERFISLKKLFVLIFDLTTMCEHFLAKRMRIFRREFMKVFLLMLLSVLHFSNGYTEESKEPPIVKVYTSPESIFLSPEGVFHTTGCNEYSPVELVAADGYGLYVIGLKDFYKCPGCGRYNSNNICYNKNCSLYLK